jgi:transposase-like protein
MHEPNGVLARRLDRDFYSALYSQNKAVHEAKALLALVRSGHSPEDIRRDIGSGTPERLATRIAFDTLCARLSADGARICSRIRLVNVSDTLRSTILRSLRSGKCSLRDVWQVFGIGNKSLWRLRHRKPDFKRVPAKRKLTGKQLEMAEKLLRAGESWRAVARQMGVSCKTLVTRIPYRKFASLRKLSPAEIERAIERLRGGATWAAVAREFGMPTSTLQKKLPFLKRGPCQERGIAA